ncbi:SRPBCC family protein [Micromonospora sp. NPDC049559]|uniref:SRPBCC family protein n=1 Tax=Micromonospora sp. NPDC049559 TaxID=3155923 RepID=UPI0034172E06
MGQGITSPGRIQQTVGRYSVRSRLLVSAPVERAFAVFTNRLDRWWVKEYTWSGPQALADIGIEPREGGMAYEIGPHGFRTDWGRVLAWQPPRRLVFVWQIGPDRAPVPDPAQASEVEVWFTPAGGERTLVELEHRNFDRHGAAAEGYREALTAGWQELLSRYADAVETDAVETAEHG